MEKPAFLDGIVSSERFERWLRRRAAAHARRDRRRGSTIASASGYRKVIHAAVVRSAGYDEYTGKPLDWRLVATYDNVESRCGKRSYKHSFGQMPTVDHVGDGLGPADFRICSWTVNDAKSDLGLAEFIALCDAVVTHNAQLSPIRSLRAL